MVEKNKIINDLVLEMKSRRKRNRDLFKHLKENQKCSRIFEVVQRLDYD